MAAATESDHIRKNAYWEILVLIVEEQPRHSPASLLSLQPTTSLVCLIGQLAMAQAWGLEPPRPAAVFPETQNGTCCGPSFERTALASVSCVLSLSISALA